MILSSIIHFDKNGKPEVFQFNVKFLDARPRGILLRVEDAYAIAEFVDRFRLAALQSDAPASAPPAQLELPA